MTIPGLALFYGGLVRTKNMLSVLMQVFTIVSLVGIVWVLYGYSMAFTERQRPQRTYIGGFSKAFLRASRRTRPSRRSPTASSFPNTSTSCFQMTFACITPALIVGAFAERMKFSALSCLFMLLWVTFVYFPIAHMVWYWGGPDDIATLPRRCAATTTPPSSGAAKLDEVYGVTAGIALQWGALDFAGGTVVHINAGIAGLVGALMLGKRVGYPREAMPPHSLTMTMIGASLLWVGWFGFNAGSNLEANGTTALAFVNTFVATAAAALCLAVRRVDRARASRRCSACVSGAVAGLVAVTPASGFAGPMGVDRPRHGRAAPSAASSSPR